MSPVRRNNSPARVASSHRSAKVATRQGSREARPLFAFRQRSLERASNRDDFSAPEKWHEPVCREATARVNAAPRMIVQDPGPGFRHAVTPEEVRDRIALLPAEFVRNLDVVQFSGMTRKRRTSPCYGMQWGTAIYLYPIEENFVEQHVTPPQPQQAIEARMYGGEWSQQGELWLLAWTAESIRDFYLNNVLIHEIGHLNDPRNSKPADRERFANWFAIEYGYRASRGRIAVR